MSDRELIVRELPTLDIRADSDDDGHFVRGIVAPYHVETDLGDYLEQFAPGVFRRSIDHRGDRIQLVEQHDTSKFHVGRAQTWEDTADGLIGTFRLSPTVRGLEALALAEAGEVAFSVGFYSLRSTTDDVNGRRRVTRQEGKLDHVGLVTNPAYVGARVLEARHDDTDEPARPFSPDDVLAAPRLAYWRSELGMRNL